MEEGSAEDWHVSYLANASCKKLPPVCVVDGDWIAEGGRVKARDKDRLNHWILTIGLDRFPAWRQLVPEAADHVTIVGPKCCAN